MKNFRLRAFLTGSALILSMFFTAGCSSSSEQDRPAEKNGKITMGFSMATLQEERWQRDMDILVAKAKTKGAEVIVQNANNNSDDQIKQVKYLLDKNIDILFIVPQDSEKSAEAVDLAKKKGIKVICYDRLIKNANVDFYVSFDNTKVGEYMASLMVSKVPIGDYIIINGAKTDYNSYMYNEGYKNILNKYIYDKSIKIVDEIWANDWRPEDSFKCVEKALQSGKKIDAILAANDSLAGAAIEALAEQQLAGKVLVAGHDADISGCQRVAEGTQLLTIYKPIDQLAEKAVDVAFGLLKNNYYACNTYISDGENDIPFAKVDPIVVTKDNLVDTVISDGFHRLEDVYLNVPRNRWPDK
ncbi:sugar ABC transporter substrate-binding protein [Ruminiclostridium cellobioparum]|jgi:D-xylose transport system substrate-binding protein|uniref:sugar ABC transporter substrate-binding protein n=1 Tax=Ruminiclostridium cellobioparum TaxID=29355 RepID=UPI0028A5D889|nr:substrate-binding domain-containing protein [Ruminiclostridium cellobioparum]